MATTRYEKADAALADLGGVLAEYVVGDMGHQDMAEALAAHIIRTVQRHGDDPEAEQYAVLGALSQLRDALNDQVATEVYRARGGRADIDDACLTWEQIGLLLGMTRQAAQQRYGQ